MKKVYQTVFGHGGNCMSAALASVFEVDLSEVPNFFEVYDGTDDGWWRCIREWLAARGYGMMCLDLNDEALLAGYDGYFIVSGKSCRELYHAVVYQRGKLVHDPHPSKVGVTKVEFVDMLYPLDPARLSINGTPAPCLHTQLRATEEGAVCEDCHAAFAA